MIQPHTYYLWISSQPDCLATVLYMLSVSSIGCSANPEWYFFVDICSHKSSNTKTFTISLITIYETNIKPRNSSPIKKKPQLSKANKTIKNTSMYFIPPPQLS